jgi:hypothetical protein
VALSIMTLSIMTLSIMGLFPPQNK